MEQIHKVDSVAWSSGCGLFLIKPVAEICQQGQRENPSASSCSEQLETISHHLKKKKSRDPEEGRGREEADVWAVGLTRSKLQEDGQ